MLWKCCTHHASKFGKLSRGIGLEKDQFSFQSHIRTMSKNVQTNPTIVFISHASKVMLKILQARLQQYMNWELPDVQDGLRKGRGTRYQIANIHWIIKRAREFKKSTSDSLTMIESLTVWITTNCGKFFKRRKYQTTLPAPWKICVQDKKQPGHGTMDWFKIGKGVHQSCILSPCLFNFYAEHIMWNIGLDNSQAGIKIVRRNINNLRYADDTTIMAENKEELKSLLMRVKVESEKVGLKLNIQKTEVMASNHITSRQIDGGKVGTVADSILLGSKIPVNGNCSHEIKRHLPLGRKAMTSLDSILKSRDITLLTKIHLAKAMIFPVVMYGCESWTIKEAEHQ